MPRLLLVETSARGDHSVSRHMTRQFVEDWLAAHPQGEVTRRDLALTALPFVDAPWLQAYFTPPPQQTPAMQDALRLSDELVAELLAADHLAIATPVYNYNVPASLKAWIDHIVRKGLTLGVDGKGLVTGRQATVLLASGGVYTEGSPIRERDIASRYLRLILEVLGFSEVSVIAGGGAKAVDLREQTMAGFLATLQPQIRAAAQA
ncbi:FMN-dependent NADH-azoreductase [Roseateles chitinivorans]|uniref:FMN-dependent NADH-azoreductase n=1 Tax=Roseateles chitinivorans TaxID=2917965 RepID=UPI003D666533